MNAGRYSTSGLGAAAKSALRGEAAAKILMPLPVSIPSPSLTPRELEVLRWTLEGKTAWEVGVILAISARTAAIHANNATRKLDCVNKHQVALRALQSGLI